MSKRYEPELHCPATTEEIEDISRSLKLNCSPALVEALAENVTGTLGSLRVLDRMADFIPEVKYHRTPGHKPEPNDRFGNAWAWRCDIPGASNGKLHGYKVAVKDNCAVAGVPMANGSLVLEGYTPEYDATVVSRILDQGGRIMGKANCDDFCLSAMGFSSPDGFLHFPDTPNRSVGGSSGGSGVLVASGQVDLAIAADQGGSIRIPAASSGTVGLKPTHGLVPYTGLVSIEPSVDHVGPIARTVTDCALFLEVLAGNDGLDDRQVNWGSGEIPDYSKLLECDMKGKKLGVLKEGFENCEPSTEKAVREFLRIINTAGLVTTDVSVPLHASAPHIFTGFAFQGSTTGLMDDGVSCKHLKGFYSTSLEKAVRQGVQSSAHQFSPGVKVFCVVGELFRRRYGNHYYTKARNLAIRLTREYDEALRHCDVLVMPTLTHTAKQFVDSKDITSPQAHKTYMEQSVSMIANTSAFNISGHPALSLPLGPLGDGTVDSIMIVGRKFDELTVLRVARALEKVCEPLRKQAGHQRVR